MIRTRLTATADNITRSANLLAVKWTFWPRQHLHTAFSQWLDRYSSLQVTDAHDECSVSREPRGQSAPLRSAPHHTLESTTQILSRAQVSGKTIASKKTEALPYSRDPV